MFICVVDLGSFTCRALCLSWSKPNYQILGLVEVPAAGVSQGEVVNSEKACNTLTEALQQLERQINKPIETINLVYSGVSSGYRNSRGLTGTTQNNLLSEPRASSARCVTKEDIVRALDSAAELPLGADFELLHEIPRRYILDDKIVRPDVGGGSGSNWEDIIGSNGTRLEVEVHIITCLRDSIDHLLDIADRGNYKLVNIFHSSIAAGYIGLTEEELEQGCLLIDMGYGGTSFQYSIEGQPLITESVPLGGYNLSKDIAVTFEISFEKAETLKLERGVCWPALVSEEETVVIPGDATSLARQIYLFDLCAVLNACVEEIFEIIYKRLQSCGCNCEYIRSVVLVGGSVHLAGMIELAEEIFESPSRLGLPNETMFDAELVLDSQLLSVSKWIQPQYTALFGLALYCLNEYFSNGGYDQQSDNYSMPEQKRQGRLFWLSWRAWRTMLAWLKRKFG